MNTKIIDLGKLPLYMQEKIAELTDDEILDLIILGYINKSKPINREIPVVVGQQGEEKIFEILSNKFDIINTTKRNHSGDFLVLYKDVKIMIEIKNYSNPVPISEVNKLKKDMDLNKTPGILISLKSNICNYKSYEFIKNFSEDLPVLLICSDNPELIIHSIKLMAQYIIFNTKYVYSDTSITSITNILKDINCNLESLRLTNAQLQSLQNTVNSEINKILLSIRTVEMSVSKDIHRAISILTQTADIKYIDHTNKYISNICNRLIRISIESGARVDVGKHNEYMIEKGDIKIYSLKVLKYGAKLFLKKELGKYPNFVKTSEKKERYIVIDKKCDIISIELYVQSISY